MRRDARTADPLEALLASEQVDDVAVAGYLDTLRHASVAVRPDDELLRIFAEGLEVEPVAAPARRRLAWRPLVARLAGAGLFAKLMLGSAVAVAGVTGGAATGSLPDPMQDAVAGVVNRVTVFELPTSASERAVERSEHGRSVADDARDPDSPGVDGREVADRARDRAEGVQSRYAPGSEIPPGLDRRAETPAGERSADVPTDRGAGQSAGSDEVDDTGTDVDGRAPRGAGPETGEERRGATPGSDRTP